MFSSSKPRCCLLNQLAAGCKPELSPEIRINEQTNSPGRIAVLTGQRQLTHDKDTVHVLSPWCPACLGLYSALPKSMGQTSDYGSQRSHHVFGGVSVLGLFLKPFQLFCSQQMGCIRLH